MLYNNFVCARARECVCVCCKPGKIRRIYLLWLLKIWFGLVLLFASGDDDDDDGIGNDGRHGDNLNEKKTHISPRFVFIWKISVNKIPFRLDQRTKSVYYTYIKHWSDCEISNEKFIYRCCCCWCSVFGQLSFVCFSNAFIFSANKSLSLHLYRNGMNFWSASKQVSKQVVMKMSEKLVQLPAQFQ